jgi:predicted dienelactone hydrolase
VDSGTLRKVYRSRTCCAFGSCTHCITQSEPSTHKLEVRCRWAAPFRRFVAAVVSWGEKYPAELGPDLAPINKFPVVILSHGIGANRFIYSNFSTYLASHGFIVAAIEHTDGLGSGAKPAGSRHGPPTAC